MPLEGQISVAINTAPSLHNQLTSLLQSLCTHAQGSLAATALTNDPAILVRTGPPSNGPSGPLRLAVVEHERWLPGIKQVGESAKTHFLRQAVSDGYDDAAFNDRKGRLSEATIWNLVFWDGETVIWPRANVLSGVTMQIIRRQLDALGVAQKDEPVTVDNTTRLAAAVMNSWTPGLSVTAFGKVSVPQADRLIELLHTAYRREPTCAP